MRIITLHLDGDLIKQCKALAKKQKITLNEFITKALTEYINQEKAKKCQIDLT
jgi:predicted HicB family RNase H-like nuclease